MSRMSGYSRLYGPDYSPNPRVPVLTTRMKMMLRALDTGGIVELTEVMYSIAETDYEISNPRRTGGNKKSLRGSMEIMLKDKTDGTRDVFNLLKSMHVDVIRACIDNTIGHWYATSAQFRTLLHEADSCTGIYGYTILLEGDSGEFLTSNQLKILGKKVENYAKSEGVQNDTEAIEIDSAYGGSDFDPVPTINGVRCWLNPAHTPGYQNKTRILGIQLQNRGKLDFVGTSPQLQSPMGVGYSSDLKKRTGQHKITPLLTSVTHTWGLVLSALKVMGVKVVPITFVLLKIWSDNHRALGEIMITMLTSSLVEDGGFNPKQAGTISSAYTTTEYEQEEQAVFIDKPWLTNNNVATRTEIEKRIETLTYIDESRRVNIVADQKKVNKLCQEIKDKLEKDKDLLVTTSIVLEEHKVEQKTISEDFDRVIGTMGYQLDFLNELAAWQQNL